MEEHGAAGVPVYIGINQYNIRHFSRFLSSPHLGGHNRYPSDIKAYFFTCRERAASRKIIAPHRIISNQVAAASPPDIIPLARKNFPAGAGQTLAVMMRLIRKGREPAVSCRR
jgi:hypothetical protein